MAAHPYQRLTRARARAGFSVAIVSRSSWWLGADHLLCIDTTGFTETYKRFYFQDIQELSMNVTNRRNAWSLVLGVLSGISLITGFAIGEMALVVWLVISGVFLLFLVINVALGRTCRCHLRSAVQTEEMAPLRRVRGAQKVLARVRPLIVAAQGGLDPEEASKRIRDLRSHSPEPAATTLSNPVADNPNSPPRIGS
jgi:hypothetical protein